MQNKWSAGEFDGIFLQEELKKRVHHALGGCFYGGFKLYIKSIVILCCALFSYIGYLQLASVDNFFYYLIMVVLLSGSLVLLSFNIFHDASHGCFSPFGFINGCITFFTASIIGVDALLWYEKHVKSHHTYTNIHGRDYDIEIGMFVKCSQYHPLRFWHRWQAYYALVLFALALLVWVYYYDFFYFFIFFIKPFKNRKNKNNGF